MVLCLSGVLAGTVIRSTGPAWVVLAGTAVIGVAITLGNIAVPVIIRRDVPWRQVSLATGAYSAAMNVGSMLTLVVTAPLAEAVGWRWAIAAWAVLTAVGLAYWLWSSRRLRTRATAAPESTAPGPGLAMADGQDWPFAVGRVVTTLAALLALTIKPLLRSPPAGRRQQPPTGPHAWVPSPNADQV